MRFDNLIEISKGKNLNFETANGVCVRAKVKKSISRSIRTSNSVIPRETVQGTRGAPPRSTKETLVCRIQLQLRDKKVISQYNLFAAILVN